MVVQTLEDLTRRRVQGDRDDRGLRDVGEAREAVYTGASRFVDDADGLAVLVHDDDGAMGAFADQVQRVGHRVSTGQHERGVPHGVTALDPGDDVGDRGDVDILGEDDEPAAPGDRLGHPAARDGGHVGDHDRDRRAGAVHGGQVDVETGLHVRPVRQEEHVVVGQVVSGPMPVEKAHDASEYPRGTLSA